MFNTERSSQLVTVVNCESIGRGFESMLALLVTYVRALSKFSLKSTCSGSSRHINWYQLSWGNIERPMASIQAFQLSCYHCKIKVLFFFLLLPCLKIT